MGESCLFRNGDMPDAEWSERTLERAQKSRFERAVAAMRHVRRDAFEGKSAQELWRTIEQCWQAVAKKPLRAQQEQEARCAVLRALERQADCLSAGEHALVERLLILDGCVLLSDYEELCAAQALSLRLWADVGTQEGRPVCHLDDTLTGPLAAAMARPEHAGVRMRLFSFEATVSAALYIAGALDDRTPQRLFCTQVLLADERDEEAQHLAQQYLWASFDCMDYEDGVLLLHPALYDPRPVLCGLRPELGEFTAEQIVGGMQGILPEEECAQRAMARALSGALRPGEDAEECAQELRMLIKQGADIEALRAVLAGRVTVMPGGTMMRALRTMLDTVPRWVCEAPQMAAMLQ